MSALSPEQGPNYNSNQIMPGVILLLLTVTAAWGIAAASVEPQPIHRLLGAFAEHRAIDRDFLWWLHEGNRAVRTGDWKLVASKGDPWELYDLSTDRAEARNLAQDDPGKVKELEAI